MADDAKNFSPIRMTASTEEAAVQQALQIVGVAREDVSVEVLGQDAKGVTVRVSPRRDDEVATSVTAVSALESASPLEDTLDVAEDVAEEVSADEAPVEENPVDEAIETEQNGEFADVSSTGQSDNFGVESDDAEAPVDEAVEIAPVDEETQGRIVGLAQEFLDRMGMEAQVNLNGQPTLVEGITRLHLSVDGEDVGILIGKHGQTLQAFQYLLNVTISNSLGEDGSGQTGAIRVVVDAGGYRARRAVSVEQQARDAAARAKRERRPIRMEPMSAHERRVVHMALAGDTSVSTSSEGRDPQRYVVITPANARSGGGRGYSSRDGGSYGSNGGFGGNRSRGGMGGYRGGGGRGGFRSGH